MKILNAFLLLTAALLFWGCGGSSGGSSTSNQFAGAYRSNFTRGTTANTTFLAIISTGGATQVVISDATGILFKGTGNTTRAGALTAIATGTGGTVGVSGTFTAGTPPTLAVNLTGAMTDSVSATQIATASQSPMTGTFTGTYSGSENGTFTVQVSSTGAVTGTVQSPSAGSIPVTGTINEAGTVTFNGSGTAGSATWTGAFFFVPTSVKAVGSGTWTNGATMSGTWTGTQS